MQKEEAAPAPPPVDPNVVIADEARKSLSTYHEAITNHDFIQAYALMTSQKQSDLGTYEAWKDGYASTLSSKILDAKPTSVAPDRVIFAYQLEARDSEGSRIKKQIISGNVTMVRQGNLWLMADSDGRVISTTYE